MRTKAPLAIVGVVWRSQTGGIPRVAGFHIGLYFEEVPAVESLSHGFAVPAPFDKGAFGVRTKAPLAKGGWFGEAKPGGFRRLAGFHIGLYYRKVPAVESLSQKSKIFASSLSQGSLWGAQTKAPLAIVGVPRHRRGGGIPQAKPAELLTYSLFTIH